MCDSDMLRREPPRLALDHQMKGRRQLARAMESTLEYKLLELPGKMMEALGKIWYYRAIWSKCSDVGVVAISREAGKEKPGVDLRASPPWK